MKNPMLSTLGAIALLALAPSCEPDDAGDVVEDTVDGVEDAAEEIGDEIGDAARKVD